MASGYTYLANGGALEHAQEMAAHESPHNEALRPHKGAADAGRGRADQVVIRFGFPLPTPLRRPQADFRYFRPLRAPYISPCMKAMMAKVVER